MFHIFRNQSQINDYVLTALKRDINISEKPFWILPTGSTPLGIYENLRLDYEGNRDSWRNIQVAHLDEYQDSNEFSNYMKKQLGSIDAINLHTWNGKAFLPEAEIERYTNLIVNPTVTILGVGENGHVAFNEPNCCSLDCVAQIVDLKPETLKINNTQFKKAYTLGLKTILSSKKIFLVITGQYKRDILNKLVDQKANNSDIPVVKLIRNLKDVKQLHILVDSVALTNFSKYQIQKHIKLQNKLLKIKSDSKVIVMVPHPDDEIFGMGGFLNYLFENQIDTTILYMTDGSGGGNPTIRMKESINAIEELGGSKRNIIFTSSFPFYKRLDRTISCQDIDLCKAIFSKSKITDLFICGDLHDPSGSHRKCYDIIMGALKALEKSVKVYEYTAGVWGTSLSKPDYVYPLAKSVVDKKLKSMKCHISQLVPPNGRSKEPFYERTMKNTKTTKWIGAEYLETFYEIKCVHDD